MVSSHYKSLHFRSTTQPFFETDTIIGPLPTLVAPGNADLETLLATIRSRIFLPSHLRTPQRKLVFRKRHHALLRAEPFIVDVADESIQLEPLDATKDIPDSWKSMEQAMDLMRSNSGDWTNLTGLLAGMHTAGRRFKSWQYEYVVRSAGDAGCGHVVVDAARAARRTGLVLRDLRIVREAFWTCRTKAVQEGWDGRSTAKALGWAEQLAGLLDDSAHCAQVGSTDVRDPRIQPDIIAVVLELAATRAERHLGGKDKDGKVRLYAERLIPNLESAAEESIDMEAARMDYELSRWSPMLNGLETAQRVLGERMPEKQVVEQKIAQLRRRLGEAKRIVEAAPTSDDQGKRRGLRWAEGMRL